MKKSKKKPAKMTLSEHYLIEKKTTDNSPGWYVVSSITKATYGPYQSKPAIKKELFDILTKDMTAAVNGSYRSETEEKTLALVLEIRETEADQIAREYAEEFQRHERSTKRRTK